MYHCSICEKEVDGKADLIEHLKSDHEPLEPISYAASVMLEQQDRDEAARDFHRRFEDIKKEMREEP